MSNQKFIEDFARLASSAFGTMGEVKKDMERQFTAQCEKLFSRMEWVKREEFEAVRAMAAKAREENEMLKQRIDRLEGTKSGKSVKTAAVSKKSKSGKKK